jgi:hypothetical protein
MHRYLLMVLAAGCIVAPAAGVPAETDPIRKLIAELGADKFQAREKASAELLKLGERALPDLLKATKSPNTEVAMRAEKLVAQIKRQLADKETAAILGEIGSDGLKDFVKKMVTEKEYATDAKWKAVEKLAQRVQEFAEKHGEDKFLKKTVGSTQGEVVRPLAVATRGMRVLHDGASRATVIEASTILSIGPIVQATSITDSLVIVAGDFQATGLRNSIVICSGAVRTTSFDNCIILAKRMVQTNGGLNSFIQAGDGASATIGTACVLLNTPNAPRFYANKNKHISLTDDPFGALQFKEATPNTLPDLRPRR